jgi:chromosome segregation ATPase
MSDNCYDNGHPIERWVKYKNKCESLHIIIQDKDAQISSLQSHLNNLKQQLSKKPTVTVVGTPEDRDEISRLTQKLREKTKECEMLSIRIPIEKEQELRDSYETQLETVYEKNKHSIENLQEQIRDKIQKQEQEIKEYNTLLDKKNQKILLLEQKQGDIYDEFQHRIDMFNEKIETSMDVNRTLSKDLELKNKECISQKDQIDRLNNIRETLIQQNQMLSSKLSEEQKKTSRLEKEILVTQTSRINDKTNIPRSMPRSGSCPRLSFKYSEYSASEHEEETEFELV